MYFKKSFSAGVCGTFTSAGITQPALSPAILDVAVEKLKLFQSRDV